MIGQVTGEDIKWTTGGEVVTEIEGLENRIEFIVISFRF